jgi:pantothenate kinase-related protein Tda10
MDRDRAYDEVVSDLTALQGQLRGVDPLEASEAFDTVTVTEGDVSVRMSAIGDRLSRLEQDLARVDARIDQEVPERYTVVEWRHFPEFNFAPQVFQLTLDDQIALLQGSIAERLEREG